MLYLALTFKIECNLKLINRLSTGNFVIAGSAHQFVASSLSSSIFRHPLFPLLALLLEKCEEATRGEVDTRVVLQGLENDVRAFIQHERDGNKTLMTDDAEVDGLVIEPMNYSTHLIQIILFFSLDA